MTTWARDVAGSQRTCTRRGWKKVSREPGIVSAADNPTRELWIGGPTVATILANRLIPGLLDRYLARNGIESQLTASSADRHRPDNLFRPVEGDFAAHGRFDHQAKRRSWQSELRSRLVRVVSRSR